MIGQTILHYRITDKLGAGGMGEVYLAHDERLDREVALKFLPADVQSDEVTRERFLREARAASKLSHPNIVGLHYIERAGERDFIVMEYVRGKSLRTVITEGKLTLPQALAIAREVADALAAAHAKGVIHRDIKADNIVLTEAGNAKVLDFGLAKMEGATQITDTSSTVGTVAYMSPEQVRGEEVDARTDLFSLGVLLYEMVASCQPFRGDHRAAVTYAIVNETPEPLARYKADVPDELQRIADKALRKDRETRYQSAADFAADLESLRNTLSAATAAAVSAAPAAGAGEAVAAPATVGTRPSWVRWFGIAFVIFLVAALGFFASRWFGGSGGDTEGDTTPAAQSAVVPPHEVPDDRIMIAVIPFENLGDAEDEYFADGITEEITARLTRIEKLGVIARTSVLRYKNTELFIGTIGEELGVDYILEGTVRWQHARESQSRVRVTPQLIRVSDATHVWADVFDEPLTEVFAVQSDIAGRVIDELDVTLTGSEQGVEPPTDNMEAYDAYLLGMNRILAGVTLGRGVAEKELLRAVELDPEFTEAYAALSTIHSDYYWYSERDEAHRRASRQYAEKALALDPKSAEARFAMGMYYYHCELDYDRALEEFGIALRIRPNDAQFIAAIAFVNRRKGNWETTVEYLKRAARLDPQYFLYYYELGETLVDLRRLDEAEWYLDKAVELNPDPSFYTWKVVLELMRGDIAAAYAAARDCPDPSTVWVSQTIAGWLDILARKYDSALDGLQAAPYDVDESHFVIIPRTQVIAEVYWRTGRPEKARVYADSARALVEARLDATPEDSRLWSALGIANALMGRKEDALQAARRAVEIMPVSKEAKQGPFRLRDLVNVLIYTGEYDEAIDHIEYLLELPAGMLTPAYLVLDPHFDPLRDDPRFQALVSAE